MSIILLSVSSSQSVSAEKPQPSQANAANVLQIEVPFVELHSGPSAGYPVVHIIEKKEKVTVLIKRTSWLKVKNKRGNEGWLHEDDLFSVSQNGEALDQTALTAQYSTAAFQNRDVEVGVMLGELEGANFYNLSLIHI